VHYGGETAADYLNTTLGFGLNGTSVVMGALLLVVLFFQFSRTFLHTSIYWLSVVLISVVGTLITDNLNRQSWCFARHDHRRLLYNSRDSLCGLVYSRKDAFDT